MDVERNNMTTIADAAEVILQITEIGKSKPWRVKDQQLVSVVICVCFNLMNSSQNSLCYPHVTVISGTKRIVRLCPLNFLLWRSHEP